MLKKIFIIIMFLFLNACSTDGYNSFNPDKPFEIEIAYENLGVEIEIFESLEDFTSFLLTPRNYVFYLDNDYEIAFDQSKIPSNRFNLYGRTKLRLSYNNGKNYFTELEQAQLEAFMQKYPYIKVGIGSSNPDVFINSDISESIKNALDITSLFNQDDESHEVLKFIGDAGVFSGKRLLLPRPQALKGIMINLDIFKEKKLKTNSLFRIDSEGYPMKDWTVEELIALARAIKDFNPNANNYYYNDYVLGLDTWYGMPDFHYIMPGMDNIQMGYDTWNGTKLNYTNSSWKSAMNLSINLHALTNGTTTRFPLEFIEKNPELSVFHIQNGTVAMDIESSQMFWVLNEAKENGINLGFWPYPKGSAGFFPPTILDYLAVSSATDYPEEAYLLAKWMSYGRDGYSSLLNFYDDSEQLPIYFPVTSNEDLWIVLKEKFKDIQGIEHIFNNIDKAKPDLKKMIPGYKEFILWVYDDSNPYGVLKLFVSSTTNLDVWAQEWERKSSEIIQRAFFELRAYLKD